MIRLGQSQREKAIHARKNKKSFVCDKKFNTGDSRDFHDSMHISPHESNFGYTTHKGKCISISEFKRLNK